MRTACPGKLRSCMPCRVVKRWAGSTKNSTLMSSRRICLASTCLRPWVTPEWTPHPTGYARASPGHSFQSNSMVNELPPPPSLYLAKICQSAPVLNIVVRSTVVRSCPGPAAELNVLCSSGPHSLSVCTRTMCPSELKSGQSSMAQPCPHMDKA